MERRSSNGGVCSPRVSGAGRWATPAATPARSSRARRAAPIGRLVALMSRLERLAHEQPLLHALDLERSRRRLFGGRACRTHGRRGRTSTDSKPAHSSCGVIRDIKFSIDSPVGAGSERGRP